MPYHLDREQCGAVVYKAARQFLLYCRRNGIHNVVTGNSGGRDSAVTFGIIQRACQMAVEKKYKLVSIAVIMQCDSLEKYTRIGRQVARRFNTELIEKDLTKILEDFYTDVLLDDTNGRGLDGQIDAIHLATNPTAKPTSEDKWTQKITRGNIMARLRMITLYHIARQIGHGMVMSTDNLSEKWMGFWTINGDVGDFGLIQNIMKGLELEDIAQYLGVPARVLKQKPDDGLGITKGGDAGQLGATYPVVDEIMIRLIQKGFNPDGPKRQLERLQDMAKADPELGKFPISLITQLAARSLNSAFKRKIGGCIALSRRQLGLPEIKNIRL